MSTTTPTHPRDLTQYQRLCARDKATRLAFQMIEDVPGLLGQIARLDYSDDALTPATVVEDWMRENEPEICTACRYDGLGPRWAEIYEFAKLQGGSDTRPYVPFPAYEPPVLSESAMDKRARIANDAAEIRRVERDEKWDAADGMSGADEPGDRWDGLS